MLAEVAQTMPRSEVPEPPAHRPVLLREALSLLAPEPGAIGVDCTLGLGGHAEALLRAVAPRGKILGLDRDPESLRLAKSRLGVFGKSFEPVLADFRSLPRILSERSIPSVDFLLADFGFSSFQMDTADRGFSFSWDGPLDMRMDRSTGETAADLLARLPMAELARLLREYGEETAARRIARAVAREKEKKPIRTTLQLARLVEEQAGKRGPRRIHPATRTFQALRIAVNRELEGLDRFVEDACRSLIPGGRAVFISFHSLEDRIVKRTLLLLTPHCVCPPELPRCGCGRPGIVERITRKAVRPGEEEILANPRSRSARLRAVRRLEGAGAAGPLERP